MEIIIEYKLEKEDYLIARLYEASISKKIIKRKNIFWIFFTFSFLILTILSHFQDQFFLTIIHFILCILSAFYYPNYFKWRYKKYYDSNIEENYSDYFGKNVTLKLSQDYLESKDKNSEMKVFFSEIFTITEMKDYFFLKISKSSMLIIPKTYINNIQEFEQYFLNKGFRIIKNLNWKW